ncbi:protein ACCELERATED CELL DEATH 6-like [Canna indica]|uniref:Protein ACCELERATED CELL DEATH 6-like n=1 Tax=Canna indica TaxID=4628 RepID=A0AAQ3KAK1_9LILI|nr:protein ACCELERATED CELL DEATH 6-like [Canna indica]
MDHIPELCPTRRREYWRAARSGNFNMLEKGISLFHLDAGRNSVLHVAAQLGHLEFAEEAVKQEPSLLTRQNIYGDTPLHCAARVGYHDIVEAFISKSLSLPAESKGGKASLEMVNKVGNTALHEAAANGHKHVVAVLLAKAPALSATNNSINGVSPLYMAVESQSAPTVQLLLDQEGASYDGPNEQTALHPAVLISYKITRLLLEKRPMLLQKTDACGSSPLHFAASKNDVLVVKLLVETDESIAYLQDNEGVSPLHVAATCGHVEIIDYLIARCPDCVNLVDNLGRIFFHVAIELKRVGVTKYMVDRSRALIDPLNKPNGEGNTPLHLAVLSPHKDIINMLVTNKNVKTNAMNNKGQTPLDLVFDEEDDEVVQKLHITSALLGGGSRFSNRRFDNIACHLRKLESEVNVDKHMINSVSIVAILIATVTFAAAFTLPGGYKSDQMILRECSWLAGIIGVLVIYIAGSMTIRNQRTCNFLFKYVRYWLIPWCKDTSDIGKRVEFASRMKIPLNAYTPPLKNIYVANVPTTWHPTLVDFAYVYLQPNAPLSDQDLVYTSLAYRPQCLLRGPTPPMTPSVLLVSSIFIEFCPRPTKPSLQVSAPLCDQDSVFTSLARWLLHHYFWPHNPYSTPRMWSCLMLLNELSLNARVQSSAPRAVIFGLIVLMRQGLGLHQLCSLAITPLLSASEPLLDSLCAVLPYAPRRARLEPTSSKRVVQRIYFEISVSSALGKELGSALGKVLGSTMDKELNLALDKELGSTLGKELSLTPDSVIMKKVIIEFDFNICNERSNICNDAIAHARPAPAMKRSITLHYVVVNAFLVPVSLMPDFRVLPTPLEQKVDN